MTSPRKRSERSLRSRLRRHPRLFAGGIASVAILTVGVGLALGTTLRDLTTAGASTTINGGIFTQGLAVPVAGTGVLDPFLRVQDNDNIEQGISTDTGGVLDETDSWTKALLLSNVPVINIAGTNYREFVLDINQLNSDPKWFLSLDETKLFLTTTPNIDTYVDGGLTGGGTLNGVAYPAYPGSGSRLGTMVFSQGDNAIKLNYSLEAGSGKPDMTLLIPDSVFGPGTDSYCDYAAPGCDTWMGFYSQFGGWNGTTVNLSKPSNDSVYPNNDGFEEWATIKRPVVNVTKTATATATKNCTWGIDKSVDDTHIDIADGGTATFNYTVAVTHSCTDTVNPVTGTITITNPATLPDGEKTVDATVNSVTDLFTPGDVAGTVTCPGGIPFTLAGGVTGGSSKVCTYSLTLGAATNGTNKATVTLSDALVAPRTATAPVTFTTTITNGSVTVVDDKTDPAHPVTLGTVSYTDPSPKNFTYSITKSGVAGTCTDYTNTATFTTNTTSTTGSDSQTVTVCVGKDLTVTKTAVPTFTRTFHWDIQKLVDKTHVDIASGGTATFNYTVRVTHDAGVDSAWATSGKITVTNPNDWEDITLTSLTDSVDNGGTCSITESAPYTINKSSSKDFHYTCSWASAPSASSGTNTATANWDKATYSTPSGSASGTATFNFNTPTTLTDESITVVDDKTDPANPVTLGTATYTDASPKDFTYSLTKSGVAGTCTDYTNIASFTTNDTKTTDSDTKTVTVCVGVDLTIDKNVTPSFGTKYKWSITKDVDKTKVTIAAGGSATFHYTVSVTHDGGTNSGWSASGKITVNNPNDFEDIVATVTDAVDNGGTCSVTDGVAVTIPKSDSVTFDYTCSWASAPSSDNGTNTATVTWDKAAAHTPNGSAHVDKGFSFATATTVTDECVSVSDTYAGTLGTACVGDANPKTFTYDRTESGVAGTCTDYNNTATFTTNDTGATGSDSKTVTVCSAVDLTVSKVASTSFKKTYHWTIKKDVDKTSVQINNGDSATFHYTVTVQHDSGTDADWQATGTITVTNPNDFESITADITDAVDNGGTCTVTNGTNVTIAASGTVTRSYTCNWSSAPNPLSGTNTATATWDKAAAHTPNGSATGTKAFAFTSATTVIDECVDVTDTFAGTLGTVCVGDANPKSFTYDRTVTPADYGNTCGTTTYNNTATFTTNDTGATGSASQSVSVTVVMCGVPGKTPGFWGNKNGHAILDKDGNGLLDTPVTIGSGSHTFTVTTIAQSDKILSNDDCVGGNPVIFTCNGSSGLLAKINTNSFEVLGAQTLALTYNIQNISGFSGQTLAALGVQPWITPTLNGLGVTSSTTVNQLLVIANNLIGNSFKPSGTATQAQIGDMNTLLGKVNREVL